MGDRTIQVALQNLINVHSDDTIFYVDAIVNSIDQANRICDCTLVGGKAQNDLPNCRLMADIDDGVLYIPTVGSTVVLLFSSYTDPIVVAFSEIDQIIFRGGDLGGLARIKDLVTKYNNLEKFCNNLQTKLNDFINKYNTHTHTGVQTGGGTSATTIATETPDNDSQLELTQRSDIENTAITQG